MRDVYLDTSALIAVLDRDEAQHAAVVAVLTALVDGQVRLIISSYTVVEAAALARKRYGMEAFRDLGELLDRACTVVWVDEALHRRAWARAAEEPRSGASLVDWVGLLVMEDLGLRRALTLDQDFRRHGVETIP